ncbi:MAG: UDP-N-acetylmuramoyl-L-alanyl-D-glutamate--2,6-diaminopimelate ligase [Clostridia bacterium]|nr:UDP-N-acetylmuramoyl-L-alanyl-D-glutamate--2,6-diaminopimelate ligase [Clostridia bacterium]
MLASKLFEEKWIWQDAEAKDITIDSRSVENGSIFVAVRGTNVDGHNFAKMAEEKGAVCVVAEEELSLNIPCIVYPDTKIALAEIASKFYEKPEEKLHLIGITGTNGKTSVSYFIKKILETQGKSVGIIGTNEILVGDKDVGIKSSTPTTPNSLELRKIFAKMLEMGAEYVVMEVSSHALDLHRVEGLSYDVGVFTNLTRDHLDYHKTMENYFLAKKKLFSISKVGVINQDDEYGNRILKEDKANKISIGTDKADLLAKDIEINEKGVKFNAVYKGNEYPVALPVSGMFSVYNGLCAFGGALALGIEPSRVAKGLSRADGVLGRLERVDVNTDYSVIIDYAHTPDGLENVLSAVNSFKKGRCIAVFGCGGDRDATKRPIMGEIGTKMADIAIITSDNPRCEDPKKIIDDIVSGAQEGKFTVVENRKEAIKYALSLAKKDDIVLLLGKGQETYQIIGKEKMHFDEREIVKEILGE